MRKNLTTVSTLAFWLSLAMAAPLPAAAAAIAPTDPLTEPHYRFTFTGVLSSVTGPAASGHQHLVGSAVRGTYRIPLSSANRSSYLYGSDTFESYDVGYYFDPDARLDLRWQGANLEAVGIQTFSATGFSYPYLGLDREETLVYRRTRMEFGVRLPTEHPWWHSYDGWVVRGDIGTAAPNGFLGPIDVATITDISTFNSWERLTIDYYDGREPSRVVLDPVIVGNYDGALFRLNSWNIDTLLLRDLAITTPDGRWTFDVTTAPPQVVPLPAAAWLLGSALAGLWAVRRHRRTRESG